MTDQAKRSAWERAHAAREAALKAAEAAPGDAAKARALDAAEDALTRADAALFGDAAA